MKLRSTIESQIEGVQHNIRKLMEEQESLNKELGEAKEREPDQITIGTLVFKRQENSFYSCKEEWGWGIQVVCSQNRDGKILWLLYLDKVQISYPDAFSADTLEELSIKIRSFVQGRATELQTLANKLNGVLEIDPIVAKLEENDFANH